MRAFVGVLLVAGGCTMLNPAFGVESTSSGGGTTSDGTTTSAIASIGDSTTRDATDDGSTTPSTSDGPRLDLGVDEGDCCSLGPGACGDRGIRECVCAVAPSCCEGEWDAGCRDMAIENCDLACDTVYDNCCTAGGTCPDLEVIACVHRFGANECSAENWTDKCTATAIEHCEVVCISEADCCSEHADRGCASADVTACVCSIDMAPECCTDGWGPACVDAAMRCNAACIAPALDCCEPHGQPSCNIKSVSGCVCEAAPACCAESWTAECVGWARTCYECPSDNECDVATNMPGCNDPDVMFDVCVVADLLTCCFDAWTQECVEAAGAA